MTASTILAILGALGGIAGVTALFNLPATRRRMSADTAQVMAKTATDAATSLVNPLREQVTRFAVELQLWREHAIVHGPWDAQAQAIANRHGEHLPPPPPLIPSTELIATHLARTKGQPET